MAGTKAFLSSKALRQSQETDWVFYSDAALNIPTVGTTQEVLKTVTLPGGLFSGTEWIGMRVFATLRAAANTNQKSAALKIGGLSGDTICATTNDATSGNRFQYEFVATKDASNFNILGIAARVTGTTFTFGTFTNTITFGNPLDITVTGTTASAAGDMILTSMRVVLLRRNV